MEKIPFYSLDYVDRNLGPVMQNALEGVLRSHWFIRGKACGSFESDFAAYSGYAHGVGVGNGLDALTLMLRGEIELGKLALGDEILVPANTYIATVLAVQAAGLMPVLVDPDRDTCNLDVSLLEKNCSEKTRGILAVHLYGRLADMAPIYAFARERNLLVFEDAAQAHGARFGKNKHCPEGVSEAAAYSFYPTKNLGAVGDGGMVVTDSQDLARVVRALGNYGSEEKYVNRFVGVNSRLDELQAAILSAKLPHLDGWNCRRREIAQRYCTEIRNTSIRLPKQPEQPESHVWHVFPVFCDRRDELQVFLKDRGIETLVHYPIPPHLQEAFGGKDSRYALRHGALPVAEELARTELSIPMGPGLSESQLDFVIESLNAFV